MNKRDEKIEYCEFDSWIIFIYICDGNEVKVALFTNGKSWFPYTTESEISAKMINEHVEKELGITQNECFKDRFIGGWVDVNYQENTESNWAGSYIRLKDKRFLNPSHHKFKSFKWFTKSEVLKLLKEKQFIVAFNQIFRKDTFWECLDTEKIFNNQNL